MLKTFAQRFVADETGAVSLDWLLQIALFGVVCAAVLGAVSAPQTQTTSGNTHYNGYTIKGQYP